MTFATSKPGKTPEAKQQSQLTRRLADCVCVHQRVDRVERRATFPALLWSAMSPARCRSQYRFCPDSLFFRLLLVKCPINFSLSKTVIKLRPFSTKTI